MKPLLIACMHGLGDNIYMRPFIRREASRRDVFLTTPWPELYSDLDSVRFIEPARQLRTQTKNIDRQPAARWTRLIPRDREAKGFWYGLKGALDNPIAEFERQFGAFDTGFAFDLPDTGPSPIQPSQRPLAVVRPVTVRKEWKNPARNPDPRYVAAAAAALRAAGWFVVSVADVDPPAEAYIGDPPVVDARYDRGELEPAELIALVRHADLAVGGIGWIVPMAIATRTPLVAICGGKGAHNAPEKVTDARRMDLSRTRFLLPDPYCRCDRQNHLCNKAIPDFDAKFSTAVARVTSGQRLAVA